MAILLDMTPVARPGARRRADRPDRARRAGETVGGLHLRRGRPRAPGRRPARARPARWSASTATPPPRRASRSWPPRSPARRASCAWTTPRAWRCSREEGVERRRGLPRPGHLLDAGRRARARLLLLLRRAARHAHGPEPGARRARGRERAGTSASSRRSSAATARTRTRAGSRARSCARRARAPLETTGELVEAIEAALPAAVRRSFGGGHPAKRVFQAIRIAVNGELDSLDRALPAGLGPAAPGRPAGRDLLPLARGPARQALPRRARARLHLPARLPGLRLRARARGRAAHRARRWRRRRRGGPEPARQVRPPARRAPHGRRRRR